jgi:hypothetical protein
MLIVFQPYRIKEDIKMKKIASMVIATALILTFCLLEFCFNSLAIRQEVSVNAVYGTPVIDGKLDDLYLNSGLISVKNFANFANNGTDTNLPAMATGEGYIMWDENNLYYFFNVKDPTPIKTSYESGSTDAIELAFDFENTNTEEARPTSYGDNGMFLKTAPYAKALGYPEGEALFHDGFSTWSEELRSAGTYQVYTAVIDTGYTVEAKLPLNDTVKSMFKVGYSFGFGASLLDDVDDDGKRDIKITWGNNDGDIQAGSMLDVSAACDKVILAAAPVDEEKEITEDSASVAENPGTSDNLPVISFISAFISIFGITFINIKNKEHKNI